MHILSLSSDFQGPCSIQYGTKHKVNSTMGGPTVVYEPDSKMIPDGMDYMREHIKLPITSHNRYWYGEGNVFTGVCLFTGGRGLHSHNAMKPPTGKAEPPFTGKVDPPPR